jgi:NTP pyrophosphatase (non-canonical NTP hydrolase)
MTQSLLDLAATSRAFRELAERKGWQAYHTPKNLAAAVAVEAAELLEIFQWLSDEQAQALQHNLPAKTRVANEAADVVMYVIELCQRLDIDLAAAVAQKIEKNSAKHNDIVR